MAATIRALLISALLILLSVVAFSYWSETAGVTQVVDELRIEAR